MQPSRETMTRTPAPGLGLNIALWVVALILAALFFVSGAALFIGRMDALILQWGYPVGVAAMIGILEILGAIGLLFRRTAGWAAVGLMLIMLGALWSHATHREYLAMITPTVGFIALTFVAWGRGLPRETRAE